MLNDLQTKYINLNKGCFLILAGAGVGKTAVIIHRFKRLTNEGNTVLCLTFSNKAANEIITRINEKQNYWIGTFHGVAFRLLMMYQIIDSKTVIIDEYDRKKILSELNLIDYIDIYDKKTPSFAYNKYREYCNDRHLIDFEYILILLHNTLENNEQIRQTIMNKFDYIMVDEYQDTSILQQNILLKLVNNNIFCVGDENQTIYTWRNANIDNILKFRNFFANAEIYSLLYNYRCDANIILLANEIIKHNTQRYDKNLMPTKPAVNKPRLIYNMKQSISTYIKNNILKNTGTKAILVRTTILLQQIEMELIQNHIQYEILNNTGIINKKEFRVIIAYLRVLCLNDITSLELFLNYPKRGYGPKAYEKIHEYIINNNVSILQALQILYQKEYDRIQSFLQQTSILLQWNEILLLTEYDNENIIVKQMFEYLKTYNLMIDFINNIILNHNTNENINENKVYLMTMHASKGLEFDSVILPYLVEGCMPCKNSIIHNTIEEERRLMYVAITRAKTHLYLMYNLQDCPRNSFGISRFLSTINNNYFIREII